MKSTTARPEETGQERSTGPDPCEGCPCPCEQRATHDADATTKSEPPACCRTCAYAGRVRDRGRVLLICVNRPDAPGLMRKVPCTRVCRNYRARQVRAGRRKRSKSPPDEVRYIALTCDRFAMVDKCDYREVARYKWSACLCGRKFYARRNEKGRGIWMHREITCAPKGMVVDHINGNGMDNCRANQRVCTMLENGHNSKPHGRSSQFKGVSYHEILEVWEAAICIDRLMHRIGAFDDEIEAARAYDREAYRRFGAFAWLNFPEEIERGSVSRHSSLVPPEAAKRQEVRSP